MNRLKLNKLNLGDEIVISGGGSNNGSKWTGHADAEGLRAIGWTDEDIAYYQTNGVNWNAEDDEYHKVSNRNKELFNLIKTAEQELEAK